MQEWQKHARIMRLRHANFRQNNRRNEKLPCDHTRSKYKMGVRWPKEKLLTIRYQFYPIRSSKIECPWSTYLPDSPRATKERNATMLFNATVYLIHQHYPLACRNLLRRTRARVSLVNIDAPLGTGAEKIKVS